MEENTLKNFNIDFEKMKKEYMDCANKIINAAVSIFLIFNPRGKAENAYHVGSLNEGLASEVTLVRGTKKMNDIKIAFSNGKITLSERKSPGSIAFEERNAWTSLEDFGQGFKAFLETKGK